MSAPRRRSPRSPRPFTTRTLGRTLGVVAALAGAGGCLDDRPATAAGPLPPAGLVITAQVSSANGAQLHVRVSYRRAPVDGAPAEVISLLDTRVPLDAGQRELAVDVSRCLGDRAREVPGPFCEVDTELELLDAANVVLDRKLLAPLRVRPGERVTAPETVQLFEVARIDVSAASSTTIVIDGNVQLSAVARDAANRDLPGRVPQWVSSQEGVATVDANGLVTGRGAGTARISALVGGKSGTVDVVVTPRPAIGLSLRTVLFAGPRGTLPGPQTVTIDNAGGGTLAGLAVAAVRFTPGQPADWLAAPTLDGTTAPTTLRLALAGADLPVGSYTAWVVLDAAGASNAPDSVQVTYAVAEGPSIALARTSVTLTARRGGAPPSATVAVTNGNPAGGTLRGLSAAVTLLTPAGAPSWLRATVGAEAATTLTLAATTTDLAPGSYTATVTVTSTLPGVAARDVGVTYVVEEGPSIRVASATVTLGARRGSSPAPTASVAVTNGNPAGGALTGLSASVELLEPAGAPAWLRASVGAEAPTTLTLAATTTDLPAGSYTAAVTVRSTLPGVAASVVSVTYTVEARAPSLVLSADRASFAAQGGEPLPAASTVSLRNAGDGTIAGLAASVVFSRGAPASWLAAQLNQTTATPTSPATLTLRVTTTEFRPIEDVARVVVTSSTPGILPETVTVDLDLTVDFTSVTTGGVHSCGLTRTGKAYCWGDNSDNQLGDGTGRQSAVPVPVLSEQRFAALSAGDAGTCGITVTDRIVCWGRRPTQSAAPATVAEGGRFSSITLGDFHACVISPPNALSNVLCWGDNGDGQVGDGTFEPRDRPTRVSDRGGSRPGPFVSVSAGAFHSCALDDKGVAFCWGNNVFGQLGIGLGVTSVEVPTPIGRVTGFSAVDAGGHSTCGLRERVPFCWGRVPPFDDPDGTRTNSIPVAVEKAPGLDVIHVGLLHFCGLSGRTAICWGVNRDGEVGNGTTATQNDPTPITPTGFTTVNADGTSSREVVSAHSCGMVDGVAFCWGSNSSGQLGDGTSAENRTRPTRVFGQPR